MTREQACVRVMESEQGRVLLKRYYSPDGDRSVLESAQKLRHDIERTERRWRGEDPLSQIDVLAKAEREKEPKLTIEQARVRVMEQRPDLVRAHREQTA